MIKVVIVNLGNNFYSAFSINQEHPLATTIRLKGRMSKDSIERMLILRFHTQRSEYKKVGIDIDPIKPNGSRRGGWKFIWTDTTVFWNKVTAKPEKETVVDMPGLKIERELPLQEAAKTAAKEFEPLYIAEQLDSGFKFTPVSEDIIRESEIPAYMKSHKKD